MKKTSDLIKMAVAVFLIVGGIILLIAIDRNVDVVNGSYEPYSLVAGLAILLFTIGSGTFYLISSNKMTGEKLMVISLFIQGFPFSVFGITCVNFFGAFIGPEIMITSSVTTNFQIAFLAGAVRNSFHFPGENFYFGINIFPLFLVWLMRHLTREEKRVAEVNTVLQNMNSFTTDKEEKPR